MISFSKFNCSRITFNVFCGAEVGSQHWAHTDTYTYIHLLYTKQCGTAVTPSTCIRGLFSPGRWLHWLRIFFLSSVPPGTCRGSTSISTRSLPSRSLPIHLSFYRLFLYSLDADVVNVQKNIWFLCRHYSDWATPALTKAYGNYHICVPNRDDGLDLYSSGARFECQPVHPLSCLRFFVVFLSVRM
jgi:hypothetical protein